MEATDRILQEIAAEGRRLEVMDAKISDLTVASTSIRADITSFRETVTDLDQRLSVVEDRVAVLPDQEAELRSLRAKVTGLEDSSSRDNVRFFGILEYKEGYDIKTFLKTALPKITGLAFSSPLEFQQAHRIGSLHKETHDKPRPIIACFLRHEQACQIISVAKSQGPLSLEGNKIDIGNKGEKRQQEKERQRDTRGQQEKKRPQEKERQRDTRGQQEKKRPQEKERQRDTRRQQERKRPQEKERQRDARRQQGRKHPQEKEGSELQEGSKGD
ncbi:hypothetical protein NDU88_001794 [Pleurodeles waltl]|uniref:Uncharacterized protein n=1 Tax=Pleurodeles waltl TaxID=8319 RepID=A0AAV7NG59_PLEWA|nr:hypothetical protein NDU88_001794 [Pleurodeles waltl]